MGRERFKFLVEFVSHVKINKRGRKGFEWLVEIASHLKINERGRERGERVVEFFSEFDVGKIGWIVERIFAEKQEGGGRGDNRIGIN